MTIQDIKNRFGIIGNSKHLERAVNIALQVAPTDLSVLINGESGTGKEVFPQIIHQLSHRKHAQYIAVNCGAIPDGTIDSELFGHEKGSFTGAVGERKGYFEVANGGTIFLDEVAELPLPTQVRLLRVLESGEYIRVGSSKTLKTDVRIVAATNININSAIAKGKFREDLYYRLNTVPITIPPLRERKEDIHLLFRKFASNFAENYKTIPLTLEEEAIKILENYRWPGNVRQLKNITEQMSILEKKRTIGSDSLIQYLPPEKETGLPVILEKGESTGFSEKDFSFFKILLDLKRDTTELKRLIFDLIPGNSSAHPEDLAAPYSSPIYDATRTLESHRLNLPDSAAKETINDTQSASIVHPAEESLSIAEKEKELIAKALEIYKNNRRKAAQALGISERTLYRKIKDYNLEE